MTNVVHYPSRIRHIGLFGLPVYEVLVMDRPYTGFGHTEVVWGYDRARRLAWGPR